MTQQEAYVEAGFRSETPEGQQNNASRLANEPEVRARRDELLERSARRNELKIQDIQEFLLTDREKAHALGQISTAVRAAELLGKQLGMFVERKEVRQGSLDDLDHGQLDAIVTAARSESARRAGEGRDRGKADEQNPQLLSGHGAATTGTVPETS
jgi:hypothetical protein